MTIDEALTIVLRKFDDILIPAKESEKASEVKNGNRAVITSVQSARAQEAQQAQEAQKKEEAGHED